MEQEKVCKLKFVLQREMWEKQIGRTRLMLLNKEKQNQIEIKAMV